MILETTRLTVRRFCLYDAPFIVTMLNDPSFIEHVGDKGVRSLDDAQRYLLDGPLASYERHGHGLWRIDLRECGTTIGMAGILKRDCLDDVDLGYSFLPAYWGRGYAFEVTSAVMTYARTQLGFSRIVAVVNEDNEASIKVLTKLGFTFQRMICFDTAGEGLPLYVSNGPPPEIAPGRAP